VIAVLNIFPFTSLEDKFREKAAKIQELFDCDVLQMPWKREIIGIPPPADLVVEYAEKYNPKNYLNQPLENWYTGPVDDLPLPLARIVCQRANLTWDAKLRRRYVKGLVMFLILLMALLAVMAWYIGLDKMDKLAYVIASFGPAATLGINEIITNIKAAASLDDLVRRMDDLWHMAFSAKVSEEELTSASRDWQTQIFLHRKNSPVLLGWIYKHFRDPDEGKSYKGTEALVEEAKRLLSRKDIDKDNDTFP
jgi:hypothetical protein